MIKKRKEQNNKQSNNDGFKERAGLWLLSFGVALVAFVGFSLMGIPDNYGRAFAILQFTTFYLNMIVIDQIKKVRKLVEK